MSPNLWDRYLWGWEWHLQKKGILSEDTHYSRKQLLDLKEEMPDEWVVYCAIWRMSR